MLLDLFLSLPFCRCVDILKAWTQHRMVQLAKIWARGLFIFIMLVLEKLWKRVWLCSHMVCFFIGWGWGVFVLIPVWVCLVGFCFVYHTAVRSQRPGPALNPADGLLSIVDRLTWRGYVTWLGQGQKPTGGWLWYRAALCVLAHHIGSQKHRFIFFLILSSAVFESVLKSSKLLFSLNFFVFLLFYLTQINITLLVVIILLCTH